MPNRILIGEDDALQRKMISLLLTKSLGYKVVEAANGTEVLAQIEAMNVTDLSAVLLDLNMPEMGGFEVLQRIRLTRPDLPVVILTSEEDPKLAVKAIKAGASDFIVKPPIVAQLDITLKNAIRMSDLSRELARLKRDKEGALGFSDLIGNTHGLAETVSYGRKAALSDVSVLISGETSTGKELLARAIHGESRRIGSPFVAINCSDIPTQMIEAVLFGYEKGTTANATMRSIGKFREAERGTVFLDDVHMLSAEAQVKLLRVLQDKEVQPLGASKPVKVNIRVISATNIDLHSEVKAGRFREDLYFRLNVLTIAMPPLRARKSDILPLVEHFIQRLSMMDALPLKSLSPDAKRYLTDYTWPGNLRELEGLVHRAMVLSDNEVIDSKLLAHIHDLNVTGVTGTNPSHLHITLQHAHGLFKTMEQLEAEILEAALNHYQHNVADAAKALGMAKSTFYRKIGEGKVQRHPSGD